MLGHFKEAQATYGPRTTVSKGGPDNKEHVPVGAIKVNHTHCGHY